MFIVEIYTKEACQPCMASKRLLNRVGVSYTEFDVSHNLPYLKELGFQQAPVLHVMYRDPEDVCCAGEFWWSGFRPDALQILGSGLACIASLGHLLSKDSYAH